MSIYDNTKDALAAIMEQFGAEILLGRLNAYLSDLAPTVSKKDKDLAYAVYEKGSAQILKNNLHSSQADKERAIKIATRELTESYIMPEMAEKIIGEFAIALGWKISAIIPVNNAPPTPAVSPLIVAPPPVSPPVIAPLPAAKTLTFGTYDGKPIIWRICEVSADGKWVYILSKDILLQKAYNDDWSSCTWETCTLRGWLNGEFLGNPANFTVQEQSRIGISTIQNEDNQWLGTKGGNVTKDRIFLPSISEVVKYFGDSGQLKNRPKDTYIKDQFNKDRIANFNSSPSWWWLRSPGYYANFAAGIVSDGLVCVSGINVNSFIGGVRPALWVNIASVTTSLQSNLTTQNAFQQDLPERKIYPAINKTPQKALEKSTTMVTELAQMMFSSVQKSIETSGYMKDKQKQIKVGDLIPFGGYDWRVLNVQSGKALIITEDIIEQRRFDSSSNKWDSCELKRYLNNEFINKFNKAQINGDIFLLSVDEVNKYFKNDEERIAKLEGKTHWWWLRSPGDYNFAAYVGSVGSVFVNGFYVYYDTGGVRPALWLNL